MHIDHIEIGNFRKLLSVRVDFAKDKTIFVGANDSGKTSAMTALRYFLKEISYSTGYAVRAAFQIPAKVTFNSVTVEALAYTFEDALLYENMAFFKGRVGTGMAGGFRRCFDKATDSVDFVRQVRDTIEKGNKADFALELLYSQDIDKLAVPAYIDHGLQWLSDQLKRKEDDLSPKATPKAGNTV